MRKKDGNQRLPKSDSNESSVLKEPLLEKHWRWLAYILIAELWLAYSLPQTPLTDFPFLALLVNYVQGIAPVIGKIDYRIAAHPEAVRLFLTLTLLLMPLKVFFFFRWITGDQPGVYRYHVISPLTDQGPKSVFEFISDPSDAADTGPRPQKQRSMLSRVIWSLMILAFTVGALVVALYFGDPNNGNPRTLERFLPFGKEGLEMWWAWSVKRMFFSSLMLAVSVCVVFDYVAYFQKRFNESMRGNTNE